MGHEVSWGRQASTATLLTTRFAATTKTGRIRRSVLLCLWDAVLAAAIEVVGSIPEQCCVPSAVVPQQATPSRNAPLLRDQLDPATHDTFPT